MRRDGGVSALREGIKASDDMEKLSGVLVLHEKVGDPRKVTTVHDRRLSSVVERYRCSRRYLRLLTSSRALLDGERRIGPDCS